MKNFTKIHWLGTKMTRQQKRLKARQLAAAQSKGWNSWEEYQEYLELERSEHKQWAPFYVKTDWKELAHLWNKYFKCTN